MIFECPIGCLCDDITICVECDFYGYVASAIAERAEKCHNSSNKDLDEIAPNQSLVKVSMIF